MFPSLMALALVALDGARSQPVDRAAPRLSFCRAFRLVVNVTNLAHPLNHNHDLHYSYISSIDTGAGSALVGSVNHAHLARVLYQNGTIAEARRGLTTIISDAGDPLVPCGLKLVGDKGNATLSTARLDVGPGSPGLLFGRMFPPYLVPDTFMFCASPSHGLLLRHAKQTRAADGTRLDDNVLPECVAVRLLPECAPLNDLAEGSFSSHDHVRRGLYFDPVEREG